MVHVIRIYLIATSIVYYKTFISAFISSDEATHTNRPFIWESHHHVQSDHIIHHPVKLKHSSSNWKSISNRISVSLSTHESSFWEVSNSSSLLTSSQPYKNQDKILECLCSPAPRSFYVIDQSIQRLNSLLAKNIHKFEIVNQSVVIFDNPILQRQVDELTKDIKSLSFLVKPGYKVEIFLEDETNRSLIWDIMKVVHKGYTTDDKIENENDFESLNTLDLAHKALDLATSSVELNIVLDQMKLENIVNAAQRRLSITYGTDLPGNQAADAAFMFALSGVTSTCLYGQLVEIAQSELRRCGPRASFKVKQILHMMEKLAASGIPLNQRYGTFIGKGTQSEIMSITQEAAMLLEKKGYKINNHFYVKILQQGRLDLFSERVPLWLWRFSSKQKKVKPMMTDDKPDTSNIEDSSNQSNIHTSFSKPLEWSTLFEDPSRPLVIDVGCGMGLSILGLSTLTDSRHQCDSVDETRIHPYNSTFLKFNWSEYNFIGADLNQQFIAYANGIATQWKIRGKHVHFVISSAEDLLEQVYKSYKGPIKLIMIQFPTPYRLQSMKRLIHKYDVGHGVDDFDNESTQNGWIAGGYNPQLPANPSIGFMVSEKLLRISSHILNKNAKESGYLLLQSNCEDVAVTMRKMVENVTSLHCFSMNEKDNSITQTPHDLVSPPSTKISELKRLPRRTLEWIKIGGIRAHGLGWIKESVLPERGATETELFCLLDGIPIHRCIFQSVAQINK